MFDFFKKKQVFVSTWFKDFKIEKVDDCFILEYKTDYDLYVQPKIIKKIFKTKEALEKFVLDEYEKVFNNTRKTIIKEIKKF